LAKKYPDIKFLDHHHLPEIPFTSQDSVGDAISIPAHISDGRTGGMDIWMMLLTKNEAGYKA
jgi:hypothetical protein